MSMMVSFVLSFFPRDVLDEILNLIESVSEDFPSYSCSYFICKRFLSSREANRKSQILSVFGKMVERHGDVPIHLK